VILLQSKFGQTTVNTSQYDVNGLYSMRLEKGRKGDHSLVISTKQTQYKCMLKGFCTLLRKAVVAIASGAVVHIEALGVGYKMVSKDGELSLRVGFSHGVLCAIPKDILILTPKPRRLSLFGIDPFRLTHIAAQIRAVKPPEPYKGKGIRLQGERIIQKEGKKK
jgi:large subunit ribosomal protein L6